jgi:hypothetical protein
MLLARRLDHSGDIYISWYISYLDHGFILIFGDASTPQILVDIDTYYPQRYRLLLESRRGRALLDAVNSVEN